MSWLKIDDGIVDHPKFVRAQRLAGSTPLHLWLAMVAYAKRHLTDGRVPVDMLPTLSGPAPRWRKRALDALLKVGLVERDGDHFLIHDFLAYNESRSAWEERQGRRRQVPAKMPSEASSSPVSKKKPEGSSVARASPERRASVARASPERRASVARASPERRSVRNDSEKLKESPVRARAKSDLRSPISETNDPPFDPPQGAPDPAPGKKPLNASRRKGKTLIPTDFEPSPSVLEFAAKHGFSRELEERTRGEFVDYWRGTGRMMADWQATYRNRLRKVAELRGLRPFQADDRWRRHQQSLRDANAKPVKLASPPAGTIARMASLHG